MNRLLIVIILILLALLLYLCNKKEELGIAIEKYEQEIMEYKTDVDDLGRISAYQKALIIENNDYTQKILKENSKLKKDLSNQIKIRSSLEIKNKEILAKIPDTIYQEKIIYQKNTRFDIINDCGYFKSHLTDSSLIIDEQSYPTDVIVSLDRENNTSIVFTNPCIKLNNLSSISIAFKTPWYNNKWTYFFGGTIAGSLSMLGIMYGISKIK